MHVCKKRFACSSHRTSLFARVRNFFMHLSNSLTKKTGALSLRVNYSSLLFDGPACALGGSLSLRLGDELILTRRCGSAALGSTRLGIGGLPFATSNAVHRFPRGQRAHVSVSVKLGVSSVGSLLGFVPSTCFRGHSGVRTRNSVLVRKDVRNFLKSDVMPGTGLYYGVRGNSCRVGSVGRNVSALRVSLSVRLGKPFPSSSFISLRRLAVGKLGASLSVRTGMAGLFGGPTIQTKVGNGISFAQLKRRFLGPSALLIRNMVSTSLSAAFAIGSLIRDQFKGVRDSKGLGVSGLGTFDRSLNVSVFVSSTCLAVSAARRGDLCVRSRGLVQVAVKVSDLGVGCGSRVDAGVDGLRVLTRASPIVSAATIVPVAKRLTFGRLEAQATSSI